MMFKRSIAFLLIFALCFTNASFYAFADDTSIEDVSTPIDNGDNLPIEDTDVEGESEIPPSDDKEKDTNNNTEENLDENLQQIAAPLATPLELTQSTGGTSYYFSSTNGNDSNNGSEGSPWRNLSKLDNLVLAPGDKVFLERGSIFEGTLKIQGKGTNGNEITVGAYGSGNKPIINGTGQNPSNISGTDNDMRATSGNPVPNASIYLYNAAYVTVSDIEVTNITPGLTVTGSGIGTGNFLAGVFVENRDDGTLKGVTLKDLYVHDVTGLVEGTNVSKMTGGIGFAVTAVSSKPEKPRFEDVVIEGCVVERVNSTGIFFDGYFNWGSGGNTVNQFYGTTSDTMGSNGFSTNFRPTGDPAEAAEKKDVLGSSEKLSWNDMKWSNVAIRDNLVTDTGKNAMIIRLTDETCVVEKNIVHNISDRAGSGNSIMSRTVYGTTFRYNEAYDNREHHDLDGSGFDADFYSPGTVWEYNYTHDNNFGLITFCTVASDKDIVVRYNVSQNDRGRILNLNYNFINTQIYNNLFYIGEKVIPTHPKGTSTGYTEDIPVIYETYKRSGGNYSGVLDYKFYNNIVYSDSNYVYHLISPDGKRNNGSTEVVINRDIDNNIFYGIGAKPDSGIQAGIGQNNIYLDPKLIFPGKAPGKRTLNGGNKTNFNFDTFKAMFDGYKLRSDSPAIGAGKQISGMPSTDISGNSINQSTPDIGPIQFQGGVTPVGFENGTAQRLSGSAPNYELGEDFLKQGVTINGGADLTGLTITPNAISTKSKGVQHVTYSYNGVDYRRSFTVVDSVLDTRTIIPTQDVFLHSNDGGGGIVNGTANLALKNAGATACRLIYYTLELSADDVAKIKENDFNKGLFSIVLDTSSGTAGTHTSQLGLFVTEQPVTLATPMTWASQPVSNELSPGANGSAEAKTYYDAFNTSHPWYADTFRNKDGAVDIPFANSRGVKLDANITDILKDKAQGVSGPLTLTLIVTVMSQSSTTPNNLVYSINSTSTGASEQTKPSLVITNGASGLDNNAKLKTLKVMDGLENIAISPNLTDSVKDYSALVPYETSVVTIKSEQQTEKTPASPQVVKVNGQVVEQDENFTVTANLNAGKNTVLIKTTAEDWDAQLEYTLTIDRLPEGVKIDYPTKTTYVEGGSVNIFDNAEDMLIKLPSTSGPRAPYLTFNAPTAKAEKVELQINISGNSGGSVKHDVGVFEVSDWQAGMTWGTQPNILENGSTSTALFGDLTSGNRDMGYITQFYAESSNSQCVVDITDFYNSKVGKGGTFSLRLIPFTTTNNSNGLKFHSINTKSSNLRPKLYVTTGAGSPTDDKTDATFKVLEGFQTATGVIGGAVQVFQEYNPPNVYAGAVNEVVESVCIIPQIPVGAVANIYRVKDGAKTLIKDQFRVSLEMGLNEFEMDVTAANGVSKRTFVLQLERSEGGGGDPNTPAEIPVDTRSYAPINPEVYLNEQFSTVNVTEEKFATLRDYKQKEIDLSMDIYRGDGMTGNNRPVIVFVHGGGFRDDSTRKQGYIVEMATRFAKLGYVTASIDYRLRKGSDMPTTADEVPAMRDASEDLNTAINWLRENANKYNFDPNYIFTAGGSAGGRTVAGYAYAKANRGFNYNGHIASAVLWGTPENEFDELYELKPGTPTYVLHGDADPTINVGYARRFVSRLEEAGVQNGTTDLFYKEAKGGVHSLTGYPDRYNFIVNGANRFFVENLKKALPYNELSVVASGGGSVTPHEGVYGSGHTVNISSSPNNGYKFDGWTATAGTLTNASAQQTSFTLPDTSVRKKVTVTANFSKISDTEGGDGDGDDDDDDDDNNNGEDDVFTYIHVSKSLKKAAATDITFNLTDIKTTKYYYAIWDGVKKITWRQVTKTSVPSNSVKAGYKILLSNSKSEAGIFDTVTLSNKYISAPKAPSASVKSTSSGVVGTTSLVFSKPYSNYQYQLAQNEASIFENSWKGCPTEGTKPTVTVSAQYQDLIFIRAAQSLIYPASVPRKGVKTLVSGNAPNVSVTIVPGEKGAEVTIIPGEGVLTKTLQYAVADANANVNDLTNTKLTKWKSVPTKGIINKVVIKEGQTIFVRTKATSKNGFSEAFKAE